MQARFLGPLGKVTGSCTWMRDEKRGWNFLIDCGMQQGEPTARDWNACEEWPFDPQDLNFVVLTHAHLDHCGLIPMLYQQGFKGSVYCTAETAKLADLQLRDTARLGGMPFGKEHVERIRYHTPGPKGETLFGEYHPVAEDLFIRFHRSGHILGAVSVTVLWGPKGSTQRGIVFSGDLGPGGHDAETQPFGRHLLHPRPEDYAVIESTYGDRIRAEEDMDPSNRRKRLAEALDRAVERGGTLAIPAFGVGRTQDVLFDIHFVVARAPERYQTMDFLLDSPSGQDVNDVTIEALDKVGPIGRNGKVRPLWLGKQVFRDLGLDKDDPDHFDHASNLCRMALSTTGESSVPKDAPGNAISAQWKSLFRTVSDRQIEMNEPAGTPRVIVMSSGMCDGGPAAVWLPTLLESPENEVALTGYCAPGSIGHELQELRPIPYTERRKLRDNLCWEKDGEPATTVRKRDIQADISILSGYSAHADQSELVDWVIHQYPREGGTYQAMARKVFVQHGGNRARKELSKAIKAKAERHGLSVETALPDDPTEWIDLESPQ